MKLTDFLRLRLDEDEAVAREAIEGNYGSYRAGQFGDVFTTAESDHSEEQSKFLDRNDPARVLAEIEAKRRIVDLTEHGCGDDYQRVQRALALPYADHADYDEAWRP